MSARQDSPPLQIDGQRYTLVCGDRFRGRAVYRGPGVYLRIGLPAQIERELDQQRLLLAYGFPVATLLGAGRHAGLAYFVEAVLGDTVWGDRLAAETQAAGAVDAASFAQMLALILRWTEAQLQHPAPAGIRADLAATVRLADVERLLPAHVELTRRAFARAQARLAPLPTVFTHGDFHPYNLCPGGVIDLEFVHWGVAGYDAVSGLCADDLLPPDPSDYRYTADQLIEATAALDALFARYHLPPAAHFLADFRLCRMMRVVQLAERRPAAQQQWIVQRYVAMATAYVGGAE